jgi:hypothetical protein
MRNEPIAEQEQTSKPADGESDLNAGLERNHSEKRLGRFALSRILIERDPAMARAIMGRCIIVRCEMMYAYDTLEYLALSPSFDAIEHGMRAPEYEVIISESGNRIDFKRSNV